MNNSARLLLRILEEMNAPILGRTKLQKIVFILNSRFGKFPDYAFSIHYYGPFSRDLAEELEYLRMQGLIEEKPIELGDLTRFNIGITEKGKHLLHSKFRIGRPASMDSMVTMARRLNDSSLEYVIDRAYAAAARSRQ